MKHRHTHHRAHRATPPTTAHPIDLDTVTTLIYLAGMDPALWEQVGPERVAQMVRRSCADPRVRVPELVALVRAARAAGHVLTDYYDQAAAFAPAVLTALTTTAAATTTAAH